MGSTQDLILSKIEEAIASDPLTLVRDGDWANTGTLRTFDGLDLVADVRYDFQRTNCRFGEMSHPVAIHYYGQPRKAGQIPEVKSSLAETVNAVVAYLRGEA